MDFSRWSVLFDNYVDCNLDELFDINVEDLENDDYIEKSKTELLAMIGEINKDKLDKLIWKVIYHMQKIEYNHLRDAIRYGVKIGMEVQYLMDKYVSDE